MSSFELGLATKIRIFSGFLELPGFLENYRIFRDVEGFLEILVNIFKVFVYLLQKSLKLGKVSSQVILTPCFATF